NAWWMTAKLAVDVKMPDFAIQVVEEALAFGESLPDQGRRPMQVLSPMNQLREIKEKHGFER
ncbi:MAG: hypothetical protein FWD31_16100, partial [Planctomycetaceae bacterium]|nr:hypothetical protein [Planctomycetaceae bacterium]